MAMMITMRPTIDDAVHIVLHGTRTQIYAFTNIARNIARSSIIQEKNHGQHYR